MFIATGFVSDQLRSAHALSPMNDFVRTSACHPIEGSSDTYHHSFGGELHPPVFPPGGKAPCHLLYTIDADDPLFPVRIQGTRLLPLIYCQQYNAAAMSYRLERDEIIVDWIERLDWDRNFPYDDYPASFPRRSIALLPADQEKLKLLEQAEEDTMDLGSRFGGWHYLCQCVPDVSCRNPSCGQGTMDVFGVIYNDPVASVRLWNLDGTWEDIEIIYQICSSCCSIQVCNRCT
jgi:hypothetical protein